MKKYFFTLLHDDGRRWHFYKKFSSAFLADRWSMKCFLLWSKGVVNYRIIFVTRESEA